MYIDNFEILVKNKIQFFADAETFMEFFKFMKNINTVLQKENLNLNFEEKNKKSANNNIYININDDINDNDDGKEIKFYEENHNIEKYNSNMNNLNTMKINLDIMDDLDLDFLI